jgi:hypothetical protein
MSPSLEEWEPGPQLLGEWPVHKEQKDGTRAHSDGYAGAGQPDLLLGSQCITACLLPL